MQLKPTLSKMTLADALPTRRAGWDPASLIRLPAQTACFALDFASDPRHSRAVVSSADRIARNEQRTQ